MSATTPTSQQHQFPCKQCGANLQYAPGTRTLACPYCGTANEIPEKHEIVEELDYQAWLAKLADERSTEETLAVQCRTCGAQTTLPPNEVADLCPFCGSAIVTEAASRKIIKPQGLLPFHVNRNQAMTLFRVWLNGLWFAPGALRRSADTTGVKGIYVPAWTYDCDTQSDYTGQRGDDYWETETYTTVENGKTVTRTRQVLKTRWHYVSGTVANRFDDILVLATTSLPRKYADALEPWDLQNVAAYSDEYLSGFVAESYRIDLPQGFEMAKQEMEGPIADTIRQDIGGDHQTIDSVSTRYFNITFKHILLPVWLSAYRYHEKTYRFMVNARTGEVQGERPYSPLKITLLVMATLIAIAIILWVLNYTGALQQLQRL